MGRGDKGENIIIFFLNIQKVLNSTRNAGYFSYFLNKKENVITEIVFEFFLLFKVSNFLFYTLHICRQHFNCFASVDFCLE